MSDVLHPSPQLLAKLGSIVAHVDEAFGPSGHDYDVEAARTLLGDAEVKEWIAGMRALALLPEPR